MTDTGNFLSNMFTKVVNNVLLCRMPFSLLAISNQFVFKLNHGTDMCIFTVKAYHSQVQIGSFSVIRGTNLRTVIIII